VIVVFDGMRPDMISEKNTPTLWNLAREGVTFRNHHSVYPSATNVNGTAMATGVYPARSGILANHEYRPEIDERNSIDVENPDVVRKADQVYAGKYVAVPQLAELVRASGRRTMIATAKGVGLLQDQHLDAKRDNGSATLFSGPINAGDALAKLLALLGPFPKRDYAQKDSWTTRALVDQCWRDGVADFSLLWLSEPDGTQHDAAPGSPAALAAIKSSDHNLARVLSELERHGARPSTDIFVVSDHGFSTIERSVDLRQILKDAGFDAVTQFTASPTRGQIMLAGNGGSVLFYVVGRHPTVTTRLVEFLQQSDFAGVIFTRDKLPGTFSLADANLENPHAPDVAMAFRWAGDNNRFGVSGMINADWQRKAGEGTHVTLSRFDMHNTLIAIGPDFRRGESDELPTGNVDLAPTICAILKVNPPSMDGRVLSEAMNIAARLSETKTNTLDATKSFPSGTWRQSLKISRVGSTIYLDEGNGSFTRDK
jgi:predicted AlkP superfamily pyrophosphatase or phosphodiesterase